MNKPDKSSIFKTSLLVALVGTAFGAQAAGLGKLMVYSAIGQPLSAEVALIAAPEELTGLSARLAPHSAFSEAGIEFSSALTGLRFNVAKASDGQPVLRLTTDAPMNEPFLHFLVELNWTAGRVVREYTFLLDPPEMLKAAKPASVVAPATPAKPAAKPVDAQAAPVKPAPQLAAPAASTTAKPAAAQATDELRVKTGDTLSKIAREHKSETVSLDQMLVALFNGNRDAFIGGNMNRLRAGKILRMPDPAEVAQVDAGEARKLVVSQAADFNAYRRRLAEAAAAAPAPDAVSSQEAAGKIRPELERAAPPPAAKDKLEVSRTEAAKSASDGTGKSGLEEDLIARDKALREAAERIAYLEKNLENLKTLVELKSQAGAQIQQQAQAVAPEKPAEEKPQAAPAAAQPATAAPAAPEAAGEKSAEPAVETKPAEAAPAPAKPPAKKPLPKKPAPPEPSFIEENPQLVFGGGGLIALLLGYLGYTAWRKKKQARDAADFQDQPSVSESEPLARSSAVLGAASESIDSGEVSIQGDFSEGGVLTTEESVDPVAEADVLMAYGRDGQAEEILKEGLKTDPARAAIHLKLLELYANRKSKAEFESVAKDLHGLSDGQGLDWDKATALAREIGLAGGLFPAAAPAVAAVVAAAAETEVSAAQAEAAEAPLPEAPAPSQASEAVVMEPSPPVAQEEALAADGGSLDFDLDLGTTSRPAVAAVQADAKPAVEEAMSLDFDFDLGAPEPAADVAASPAPMPAPTESMEAGGAIDFSLDVGGAQESVPALTATAEGVEAAKAAEDANAIDFSLDLGSLGEPAEALPEPAAEGASTAVAGDIPGDVGADLDLELGALLPAEAADNLPVAAPSLDLADISLDLGEPDLPDVEAPVAASPSLASIDLDLDTELPDVAVESPVDLPEIALDGAPDSLPEAAAPELDEVPDDPEVATKLELAQAYEEMGDREGARELLNEVLSEGSPAQQALAQARLDQLDT